MPHASGCIHRGGDGHGPNNISSAALCVKLSEVTSSIPTEVMGRATAITRARAAENFFIKSVFKETCAKFIFLLLQQLCCKRYKARQNKQTYGHARAISFEAATPMPDASGRSPRRCSIPPLLHPSPLPCSPFPAPSLPAGSPPTFALL